MPDDKQHLHALEAQRNIYQTILDALKVEMAANGGEESASPDTITKIRNAERQLLRVEKELRDGNPVAPVAEDDFQESWVVLDELWNAYRRVTSRIKDHERRLSHVESKIMPPLKQRLSLCLFSALLAISVISWLIEEIRDYYLIYPGLGVTITLLLIALAILVKWLPEPYAPSGEEVNDKSPKR